MSAIFSSAILNAHGAGREGLARAEERLALFPEPAILIAHIRSAEQEAHLLREITQGNAFRRYVIAA